MGVTVLGTRTASGLLKKYGHGGTATRRMLITRFRVDYGGLLMSSTVGHTLLLNQIWSLAPDLFEGGGVTSRALQLDDVPAVLRL